MATDRISFGTVLDREGPDRKIWLIVIPLLVLIVGGVVWGFASVSRADGVSRELERAKARNGELERSLDERDRLLAQARADDSVLRSPGQATALFYGADAAATESGVAVANPAEKAIRVYLYGLVAPPAGQEYVLVARGRQGAPRPLGVIAPSELGSGFLLARDVPEGTTSVELLFRPKGSDGLDQATPRVAARYPATAQDRGVLVQPVAQARRGRR